MVQPYNYMLNVPNPMEAFTGGITAGQSALQAIENARKIQAQRVAEQVAAQKQEQLMAKIAAFQDKPSYQAAMNIALDVPKDQFENLIGAWESKNKEQQQNELRFGGQVMAALAGKKNDVAIMLLEQRAEALGDVPEAEDLRRTAELVRNDPGGALGIVATSYAALPGSKDIIDRAFAAQAAPLLARKTDLEIQALKKKLEDANNAAVQGTDLRVQSSKILDDGTAVSVLTDGSTVVRNPQGAVVSGADAAKAVREAQNYGATLQELREGARVTGREVTKVGIDQGRQALETIPKIRSNLSNLRRAKELVDKEGAQTGAIAERFPSWRASTIELLNLRNQLGIDVINSATFGALSESELELALQTALPTKMDQEELSNWIQSKIDAQEKLATYMEDAALFFLRGGSAADWLEQERMKAKGMATGEQPATPAATQAPPTSTQGFSIRGVRQ
jgi:hypothetical protein